MRWCLILYVSLWLFTDVLSVRSSTLKQCERAAGEQNSRVSSTTQQHRSVWTLQSAHGTMTRHKTQTHTQRQREAAAAGQLSLKPLSSSSSSSSGVLNMSWSNRFTAERESWWTEGPVQTVHTQEPEPESPLKSFTKLKHGLFKAILSSLLHFIDLINLTC